VGPVDLDADPGHRSTGDVQRMSMRRLVGVVAALSLAVARPAPAHETAAGDVVPTVDALPARLDGVTVQLRRTLAHQLVVENRTGRVLEVLDEHGAPFLRLGPAGAEVRRKDGWARVATIPAWGWFDRRLDPRGIAVPHRTRDAGVPASVAAWTIPMRLGGVPVALAGHFRFVPLASGRVGPRLTSPAEPFPGVHVSLVPGRVPALYLENGGTEPVVVLGTSGEPFLLIGADGTSANVRSPTWRRTGKAAVTDVDAPTDPGAAPEWQLQSRSPRYAWIEFRAQATGWSVPLRRGAETATLRGE
jgi:hypothetical protein